MKIIHKESLIDLTNLKDTCVILGCAHNIFSDIDNLPISIKESDVMCVNAIIQDYNFRIKHYVSFESTTYWQWFNNRKYRESNIITHSTKGWNIANTDIYWDMENVAAIYSGNLAVLIADSLNYKQIYLCGMPMDGKLKYFTDKNGESQDRTNSMLASFTNILKYVDYTKLYSMSGETKRVLVNYK